MADVINDSSNVTRDSTDEHIFDAAREIHQEDGEIEIDESREISFGEDPGCYVAAWVWVPFTDGEDGT